MAAHVDQYLRTRTALGEVQLVGKMGETEGNESRAIERNILDDIENCVEGEAKQLPLLSVPRHSALIHVATVFEDTLREHGMSRHAVLVGLKYALNHALDWIYRSCPIAEDSDARINSEHYQLAQHALSFALDYDWLFSAFRQYFAGRATLDVRPPLLRFVDLHKRADDRRLLDLALWREREEAAIEKINFKPNAEVLRCVRDGLRKVDDHTIAYEEERFIAEFYLGTTGPNIATNLPLDVSNGAYTLREARYVWSQLVAYAFAHHTRCDFSASVGVANPVNSRVPRISLEQLMQVLSNYGPRGPEPFVEAVLRDLILTGSGKCDVRSQPLLGSGDEILLLPNLMMTLLWEPCFSILWSRRYSGVYGAHIASFKAGLASELADAFGNNRFVTSVMRKLKDRSGRVIGDADVAVYDTAQRHLSLFEIKWLIAPEDFLEVHSADRELLHGVKQAALAKSTLEANQAEALRSLFPQKRSLPTPLTVEAFVLCRGTIGSQFVAETEIPIYDFDRCRDLVVRADSHVLGSITSQFQTTLQFPPDRDNYRLAYDIVEICGWDIRVPGMTYVTAEDLPTVQRNAACPCRSGLKFKRCCGR